MKRHLAMAVVALSLAGCGLGAADVQPAQSATQKQAQASSEIDPNNSGGGSDPGPVPSGACDGLTPEQCYEVTLAWQLKMFTLYNSLIQMYHDMNCTIVGC